MAKKIRIAGREYISLSAPFFVDVMDKIHNNNDYDENYAPTIKDRILKFSKENGCDVTVVLVPPKLLTWMEIEYSKHPLPWRDTYSRKHKETRQDAG